MWQFVIYLKISVSEKNILHYSDKGLPSSGCLLTIHITIVIYEMDKDWNYVEKNIKIKNYIYGYCLSNCWKHFPLRYVKSWSMIGRMNTPTVY